MIPFNKPYITGRELGCVALVQASAHLGNGLAMGASRTIHVAAENTAQPLAAGRLFLKLIEKLGLARQP